MLNSKVFVGLILLMSIIHVVLDLNGFKEHSILLRIIIAPSITFLYILFARRKNYLFLAFLICYSLANILTIVVMMSNIDFDAEYFYNFDYRIGCTLNITAYILLTIKILQGLNFIKILLRYWIHALIMFILSAYLLYVLHHIVTPELLFAFEFYLELLYNISVFALLSMSFLNYLFKDNAKSLYLFIGSLCIFFSELMDIAYIYIDKRWNIKLLSLIALLLAFYFLYYQSQLLNFSGPKDQQKVSKS